MDISALISPAVNRPELARVLDDVADDVRLKSLYELDRRDMARLFEAARDNDPLALHDLVPEDTPPGVEVIHDGRNSLVLFRSCRKRFCRSSSDRELWGYNDQPLSNWTGAGYFVAYESEPTENGRREVVFDYSRLPSGPVPDGWPPVAGNDKGLSRFIFGDMTDVVRRVSRFVSIGRVHQRGRPRDTWFMLVRRTGRAASVLPYPRP